MHLQEDDLSSVLFPVFSVWQQFSNGWVSVPESGTEPGYPVGPGIQEKYANTHSELRNSFNLLRRAEILQMFAG